MHTHICINKSIKTMSAEIKGINQLEQLPTTNICPISRQKKNFVRNWKMLEG